MKQTSIYLCVSLLLAFTSQAQWSGGTDELLTSGDAEIQGATPNLIINQNLLPIGGLQPGVIYQSLGSDRIYNFFNRSNNQLYWAKADGWDHQNGSTNALSIDLELPDMNANVRGILQIGPNDSAHLDFDENEIQSRQDLGTGTLFVNNIGGDIVLGNAVTHGGIHYDRSEKKVGLGTNIPQDELHVMGQARIQDDLPNLKFYDSDDTYRGIIQSFPGSQSADAEFQVYSPDPLNFYSGIAAPAKLTIMTDGNVGIGEINPAYTLDVNGDGNFTGELTAASDLRLKRNIEPIDNASHILNMLNPVSYEFNHEAYPELSLSQGTRLGLIAQEVEEVLPDLVSAKSQLVDEDGSMIHYKSLNYIDMIPILIKSHQEQSAEIKELRTEIELLKSDQ